MRVLARDHKHHLSSSLEDVAINSGIFHFIFYQSFYRFQYTMYELSWMFLEDELSNVDSTYIAGPANRQAWLKSCCVK